MTKSSTITIVSILGITAALIILISIIGLNSELGLYNQAGSFTRFCEYPPLATLLFAINSNIPGINFQSAWIATYILILIGVSFYIKTYDSPSDTWHFPLALLLLSYALGPNLVLARYDYIIAALIYLSYRAFSRQRYQHSAIFILVAAFLKIIPIIILPLLWLYTPSIHRLKVLKTSLITATILFLIPIITLGLQRTVNNVSFLLNYHHDRGVGFESTWSSFHLSRTSYANQRADIGFHHGALHNDSLASYSIIFQLTMFTGILAVLMNATFKSRKNQGDDRYFFHDLNIILLTFMILTPVLSPQYFVWVFPLIIIWWFKLPPTTRFSKLNLSTIALVYLTAFFSLLVYPVLFLATYQQKPVAITVLHLRTILLILLTIIAIKVLSPSPFNKASSSNQTS